jgi:hypothetical protein
VTGARPEHRIAAIKPEEEHAMSDEATILRSRRALLAATLGGVTASALQALGRPQTVAAANGDTVKVGGSFTGTETTTITNTHNASGQIGVRGINSAATATVDGVRGEVLSTGGRGVVGWAKATDGPTRGVYGRVESPLGDGVYGYAASSEGGTGVSGVALAPTGIGVFGWATSTGSASSHGVFGRSDSGSGTGVQGEAADGTGVEGRGALGMFALSLDDSATATGIWARSGHGRGVLGDTLTGGGTGVHGRAARGVGVHAETNDPDGTALLATGAIRFEGAAGFAVVPHGSKKVTVSAAPSIRIGANSKVVAMLQGGNSTAPGVRRVSVDAAANTFTIVLAGTNGTGSDARVAWFLFS